MKLQGHIQTRFQSPLQTRSRCLVCGFSEVRTDEVVDRGIVILHECPHCEHRWTRLLDAPVRVEGPRRVAREVPAAA